MANPGTTVVQHVWGEKKAVPLQEVLEKSDWTLLKLPSWLGYSPCWWLIPCQRVPTCTNPSIPRRRVPCCGICHAIHVNPIQSIRSKIHSHEAVALPRRRTRNCAWQWAIVVLLPCNQMWIRTQNSLTIIKHLKNQIFMVDFLVKTISPIHTIKFQLTGA